MVNTGVIGRMRVYFGFSRMSHSVLDIGYPGFGALLVLGAFPSYPTLILGLIAAFSGFTAVFALNDLMDFRVDTERIDKYQRGFTDFDLDVLGLRHPIAQKALSFTQALVWVLFWGMLSMAIAYRLNPACFLILISAVACEIAYCALLRVTHWKTLLSGTMVGIGTLAGVFAVASEPPRSFVLLLFIWSCAWEIGARNIPNDWTDLEEDIHLGIRTLPVRYGKSLTSRVSFILLCVTVLVSLLLPFSISLPNVASYEAGACAAGGFLLLAPGLRWARENSLNSAMILFNRACFYPLAMLAVAVLSLN
ncbi:MAG: UbiA family prenyltransferase [Syntrophorhabdales bacterium]|jgi:4-hydroxybenzoate polyprenyltransferase